MLYEGLTDSPTPASADAPVSSFRLRRANLYYCGKFLVFMILCYVFFYTGDAWLGKIINSNYDSQVSLGTSLVSRTTSSLALWYFVHAILTFSNENLVDSCQFTIHVSLPWLHSLLYVPVWIGFWFIPDSFFNTYLTIGFWISGVYLVVQMFFLIELFQYLNDRLGRRKQFCLMGTITAVLTALAAAAFGVFYWLFSPDGSASIAIISVNLCLCIGLWILSIVIEHGSILTASFISVYVAFLTSTGLLEDSPLAENTTVDATIFSIVAGVFTLVWLVYLSFTSSFGFQELFPCFMDDKGQADCVCCCCLEPEDPARQSCGCLCSRPTPFSLSSFHGMLAMATVYVTMLVTHWGNGADPTGLDGGKVARWVNLGASWLVCLLYAWTLFAPFICPDRDFDHQIEP